MFAALLSHNDADPSWSQTGFDVQNLMGAVGANVSDILLFWLGYGAFIVPITLLYLGFCVFVKDFNFFEVDFFTVGIRILGYFFLLLSFLALVSMNASNTDTMQSGGIIGGIISSFTISLFGELGTSLVFLALFLIGIPFFTGISWLAICDFLGDSFFNMVFFRSNAERRKAENQLKKMAQYRDSVSDKDETETEEDSGELTVFDPETGFSIYLRDDEEIKYDGSCYDDDDYPKIRDRRETVVGRQVVPQETINESNANKPVMQVVAENAQKHNNNQSLQNNQRQYQTQSQTQHVPVQQNRQETVTQQTEFHMPKFTVYDEDESENIINKASTSIASSSQAVTARPVTSYVQNEAMNAKTPQDQVVQTTKVMSAKEASYPTNVSDRHSQSDASIQSQSAVVPLYTPTSSETVNTPVEIDFTNTTNSTEQRNTTSDERVDVWNYSEDEDNDKENEVHSSYQTSSNIGAYTPEDPNEAIERAAENIGDDDIPSYLEPGQRSVLDDDDYSSSSYSNISSSNENRSNLGNNYPSSTSEVIRNGNVEGKSNDEDDYDSNVYDESLSQVDLQRLRGKYNPHVLPPVSLLNPVPPKTISVSQEFLDEMGHRIEEKLRDFKIIATVRGAEPGPVITRFALELSPGTKTSKISAISSDLARVLSVISVRVVEIIPGTPYVGLEIANEKRQTVYFRELIDSDIFRSKQDKLTCGLGCSIVGNPVVMNLAKMPHLLVAGTTGSGKSVGVNGMILSMLFKSTPDDLRLIMIDPKMLEFSSYNRIPHLLTEIVTDMKDATNALRWCVGEMERRYKLMSRLNVKKIDEYNAKVLKSIESGEPMLDPLWERTAQLSDKRPYLAKLPYIVVVIDELADMMMQIGKKVEELIARLAQKARAAGIHMILATQSPRKEVLTGLIKGNIPSRLAFTVSSSLESRIVLEQMGAESLLGNGDMLFNPTGSNTLNRIHGAYVTPEEIDRVVNFWRQQGAPEYVDNIFDDEVTDENALPSEKTEIAARASDASNQDLLFDEAVKVIITTKKASTSILQRKMGIGYPRAAKLIDAIEDAGLISAPIDGAGKRNILVDESYFSGAGENY